MMASKTNQILSTFGSIMDSAKDAVTQNLVSAGSDLKLDREQLSKLVRIINISFAQISHNGLKQLEKEVEGPKPSPFRWKKKA